MSARVSVIVPAYNAAASLGRAVRSALAQEPEGGLEVVIVDDGSTDGTLELARGLAAADGRVRVVARANGGPAAARNAGAAEASGDFLAFLDADDEWLPGKLAAQLGLFAERPDLVLLSCAMNGRSYRGRPRYFEVGFRGLLLKNWVLTSGAVARSEHFRATGGFDPARRLSEDYELWLRLALRGPVGILNESLFAYAPGGASSRLWRMELGELETYRILAREGHLPSAAHAGLVLWSLLKFAARALGRAAR